MKQEFFKLDCGVSTPEAPLEEAATVVHFCHHVSMHSLFCCFFFSHSSGMVLKHYGYYHDLHF